MAAHVVAAAEQVAAGMQRSSLPPCLDIRIKPLTAEFMARSTRTLDLFVSALVRTAVLLLRGARRMAGGVRGDIA